MRPFLEAVVIRCRLEVRLMAGETMRALAAEVASQCDVLARFSKSKLPRASKGSIFVGAGDSYAAALAGFHRSMGRCIALDPYTLASAPEIAQGLEVFFISVSGRTASNVAAANRVTRIAKRTTVLTADDESPLAKQAERVVRLPMSYVPRTPGMLSFSLSLLAVLIIAAGREPIDFRRAFVNAKKDQGRPSLGKGTTYFLGNSLAYPIALYTAAKAYELLGSKAHAELLEEFSHLELFSIAREDAVNAFSCFDPSGMAAKLTRALSEEGYRSSLVPSRGVSDLERLFHSVFVAQLSVLEEATMLGISEPKFLAAGGRLRTSDSMIY